jgi:hypothetical protein
MSGDRQWTITPGFSAFSVGASGSRLKPGERVRVVEASRLAAVEAERDAYRETLEEIGERSGLRGPEPAMAVAVLARFPKNETEQT